MQDPMQASKELKKVAVFQNAAMLLTQKHFRLIDLDITRPWGFFLSVDETQAQRFIAEFYKGTSLSLDKSLALRPKILGIEPRQRLSWQFHHRRSEVWRTIEGSYKLITSQTDEESESRLIKTGEVVSIPQGIRHRAIGAGQWALIAEIWQHTQPGKPSNEEDIVRIQDDYGR